jgi:hypothetical protein
MSSRLFESIGRRPVGAGAAAGDGYAASRNVAPNAEIVAVASPDAASRDDDRHPRLLALLRRPISRVLLAIGCVACHPFAIVAQEPANAGTSPDQSSLQQQIETKLRLHGNNVAASVWLGSDGGGPWFEYHGNVARPTASAIKTFYLVELFAAFENSLDQPLPGSEHILQDNQHPAISHFSPQVREEIRQELSSASVRRIGEIMMGKAGVENAVYNAAANLVTAHFGGPESLTAAIHRRSPGFKEVFVRRYMLRDRTQPGDNEAPAAALAALYQSLATKKLAGISDRTMDAVYAVLFRRKDDKHGLLYEKDGALSSEPVTAIKAGWWDTPKGSIVFVVMCVEPVARQRDRSAASDELGRTAGAIVELVTVAGKMRLPQ